MDLATLIGRLMPVLAALSLATVIESLVPLRQQSRRLHGRLATNLALLGMTLGLGLLVNFTLAVGAAYVAELEHANIRVPRWLDRVLVCVWVTPHMHKIHHSRQQTETDSNYANLFSFFDRLFRTYTPKSRGTSVAYGIDGYDGREHQSLWAVLWLPFRRSERSAGFSDRLRGESRAQ